MTSTSSLPTDAGASGAPVTLARPGVPRPQAKRTSVLPDEGASLLPSLPPVLTVPGVGELTWAAATASDFAFLRSLYRQTMQYDVARAVGSWDDAFQGERLAKYFAPRRLLFIMLAGERVGCIDAALLAHTIHVSQFYIEATHQGRGIGRAVLTALSAVADDLGFPIELSVLHGAAARRTYAAAGFTTIARDDYCEHLVRQPAFQVITRVLRPLYATDPVLKQVAALVCATMVTDDAHGFAHLARTATWTMRILAEEGHTTVGPRVAVAAALLHDVVNLPKDHPERATASAQSAAFAQAHLPALGYTPDEVTLIADAIRDHSYSRGAVPVSPLGQALQDADRLEALGAIGLIRTFVTGATLNRAAMNALDPWGTHRPLDDQANSLDHFFLKLFSLVRTMNTAAGRREGAKRELVLIQFLTALGEELGQPAPLPARATIG